MHKLQLNSKFSDYTTKRVESLCFGICCAFWLLQPKFSSPFPQSLSDRQMEVAPDPVWEHMPPAFSCRSSHLCESQTSHSSPGCHSLSRPPEVRMPQSPAGNIVPYQLTLFMPWLSFSIRLWCIFAPVALRGLTLHTLEMKNCARFQDFA